MGERTNGRAIFLMADSGEYAEHLVCGGIVHWNQGRGPCPYAREGRFPGLGSDGDGGFHFTAEMEIRPELELKDPSEVELPPFSLEVTDAEIESELERLREEQASWEPADDDATGSDGMLVEADLHGEVEGGDGENGEHYCHCDNS